MQLRQATQVWYEIKGKCGCLGATLLVCFVKKVGDGDAKWPVPVPTSLTLVRVAFAD